jgi:ABC-type phosphate transport system substrate-binding protein
MRGDLPTIARRFPLLVLAVTICSAVVSDGAKRTEKDLPPGTIQLYDTGSTFAAPLQKKWIEAYQKRRPEVLVSYEGIGSGEGTKQFLAVRLPPQVVSRAVRAVESIR